MSLIYRREIFNKVINTGVTYYTDASFEELLGSADEVTLQVIVDATPGATTASAQYQSANTSNQSASLWFANANFPTATASPSGPTDVPTNGLSKSNTSFPVGSRGRVAVSCSAQNGVRVRVIAAGRSRKGS